ncbi:MAG: amino acid ABC transporter ATP-binding protein [Parafilimonas terrae]|nr:amino acid ABC transporter ATP-binding protein [Parafilimonas terrae]
MITIEHVRKSFGQHRIFEDLSLTFADGSVVAVLGPSGSGKSTLIRCINGLEPIDGGDIVVDGHSVRTRAGLAAIRRQCAMVFQSFNLYPHLTVEENITLAPRLVLKVPATEARARAGELLALVGLQGRGGSYPAQLSGGQQQRVGICRALAMQPRSLLLDEVTSSLDPEMTADVLAVIERLARGGTTMVLVTHEMEFARRVANRVVFLEHGRILADQPTAQFFGSGQDTRIQSFLNKMSHRPDGAPA